MGNLVGCLLRGTDVLKRILILVIGLGVLVALSLLYPPMRQAVRSIVRPEPPPQITPLAMVVPPTRTASPTPTLTPTPSPTTVPATHAATPTVEPTATPTLPPTATLTPSPVVINGRTYDAYIPAASKEGQAYQYSCEFDAAWVILQTYGFDVDVDTIIGLMEHDTSIEPYIEETRQGFLIHGGDIRRAFSGDYTKNFLARSTGEAIRPVFEHYDLATKPVRDRAALEEALRAGELVWMKTTVDFKPWRPATWLMPDGSTHQTVLGNDHAVVVIGYNAESVVIRDVLGPTSSNWQRPYEYEVDWPTFMASWGAQDYDALAVSPP